MNDEHDLPVPERCPYCLERQIPKECFEKTYPDTVENLLGIYRDDELPDIFRVFQCLKCSKFFMQVYTEGTNNKGYLSYIPTNYELALDNIDIDINQDIKDLSPDFVEVYTQAYSADKFGLTRICGVGYRKSLEFLIKDYAISTHPQDIDKIQKEPLGTVINNYFAEVPILLQMAESAVWLGNDETHYLRKHPTKDVSDMKRFINTTVFFIEGIISSQEVHDEPQLATPAGIKEDYLDISDDDLPF